MSDSERGAAVKRVMCLSESKWNFAIVGERGAIHYHVAPEFRGMHAAGIEMHSRTPLGGCAADRGDCWLLGGPCWHDGSSLAAEELWTPLFVRCNESGDFEPLWEALKTEYYGRFESAER